MMGNSKDTDVPACLPASHLTPLQVRAVATLGFCGFVSAADNWFVSPALPAIARTLSVAPTVAVVVLTAYMIPYGVLQPFCGALCDRVGRLRLLRIIVLGLCAGTMLCAVAPTLPLLVVARIVTGCFAAGIIAVSQAFVSDLVEPRKRAGAIGLLMGITYAGQGLSTGLGGILTDLVGWRAAFGTFCLLACIAWSLLFTLREPDHATTGDCTVADARPNRDDGSPASIIHSAIRIFTGSHRGVYLLACMTGAFYLGTYGLMGTFLNEVCGLVTAHSGLVMMLYGVLCLAGGFVSGRIAARCGRLRAIAIGEAFGAVAAILLIVCTIGGSWIAAPFAAACLGAGYIFVQSTLVTLSMEADPSRVGLCSGLIGFGVFVGGGVGSTAGSILLAVGGYPMLWAVMLAVIVAQLVGGHRLLGRNGL